jgi:hypothetical protein
VVGWFSATGANLNFFVMKSKILKALAVLAAVLGAIGVFTLFFGPLGLVTSSGAVLVGLGELID